MSRYYRTTITLDNGCIQTARIDSTTGEVRAFAYRLPDEMPKVRCKENHLDTEPFWVAYLDAATNKESKLTKTTAVRKSKDNANNIFLESYMLLDDAVEELPILDDLITGVSYMDSGSNKLISKGLLFAMLRDLEVINFDTIKQYTGYSDSYCYKLAQHLRVLSIAFDREVER